MSQIFIYTNQAWCILGRFISVNQWETERRSMELTMPGFVFSLLLANAVAHTHRTPYPTAVKFLQPRLYDLQRPKYRWFHGFPRSEPHTSLFQLTSCRLTCNHNAYWTWQDLNLVYYLISAECGWFGVAIPVDIAEDRAYFVLLHEAASNACR